MRTSRKRLGTWPTQLVLGIGAGVVEPAFGLVEFISTLRLRMNSFLNDKRMAIPLMLKEKFAFEQRYSLPIYCFFIR